MKRDSNGRDGKGGTWNGGWRLRFENEKSWRKGGKETRQGRKESSNFTFHGPMTPMLSKAWLGVLKEDKIFRLVIMGDGAGD